MEVVDEGYEGCIVGPIRSGVAGWVMVQDAGRMIAADGVARVVHGLGDGVGEVGRIGAAWGGVRQVGGVVRRAIGWH